MRLSVWVPDELGQAAKKAKLPIELIVIGALNQALDRHAEFMARAAEIFAAARDESGETL